VVRILCSVSLLSFVFNIYFLLSFFFSKYRVSFSVSTYFIFILLFLLVFGSIFVELSRKLFIAYFYPYRLTTRIAAEMLRQTSGINSPTTKAKNNVHIVYFREHIVCRVQPPTLA